MATIEPYETKTGTRYRVRYRKPDRRQTDRRGFKTKRDAKLFAATVETDKAMGTYIDPSAGRVKIGKLGDEWLTQLTNVSRQTADAYETSFRLHVRPVFGDTPINALTASQVRSWVADMDKGARTIRRAHYVLQAICQTAAEDRRIVTNPARGIKNLPPIPQKSNVYLSYQQVEKLTSLAPEKYKLPIYLAAYCGLRWGEIDGLQREDIDLKRRRIHIRRTTTRYGANEPKNRTMRKVGYPEFLAPLLRPAVMSVQDDMRVFDLAKPKNQESWWETLRKAAGLPKGFVFHDLRHAAASFAISSGASVKLVQNMLGHRDASMTLQVYAELFDSDVDLVAERITEARREAL